VILTVEVLTDDMAQCYRLVGVLYSQQY
jgi:hypothetical protein